MTEQHKDEFELDWWNTFCNNCVNTFGEEYKHYTYARRMGLVQKFHYFDIPRLNILDIGGGPASMLLKCPNLHRGVVIDPIKYPEWCRDRYKSVNIKAIKSRGEDIDTVKYSKAFDEVWIYNCLQHTDDPELIIQNAKAVADVLRIFEWIDIPAHIGHPQELKEQSLNNWIGQKGVVEDLKEPCGCFGKAYYGVFKL
jgi:hypothetical protein